MKSPNPPTDMFIYAALETTDCFSWVIDTATMRVELYGPLEAI